MIKSKPIYAPLPARAVADQRLNGLPLRVLAAIALRDRMSLSKGGKGCFASNKLLCVICRCNEPNLSRAISELELLGYLSREGTQRSRVLRVIYTDHDADVASQKAERDYPTEQSRGDRDYPAKQSSLSPRINDFIKPAYSVRSKALRDQLNPPLIYSQREPLIDSLNRTGSDGSERIEPTRIEPEQSEQEPYDNGFDEKFPGAEHYRGVVK